MASALEPGEAALIRLREVQLGFTAVERMTRTTEGACDVWNMVTTSVASAGVKGRGGGVIGDGLGCQRTQPREPGPRPDVAYIPRDSVASVLHAPRSCLLAFVYVCIFLLSMCEPMESSFFFKKN